MGPRKADPIAKRVANQFSFEELMAKAKEMAAKYEMLDADGSDPKIKYSEGHKRIKFEIEDAEDLELAFSHAEKNKTKSLTFYIKTAKSYEKAYEKSNEKNDQEPKEKRERREKRQKEKGPKMTKKAIKEMIFA